MKAILKLLAINDLPENYLVNHLRDRGFSFDTIISDCKTFVIYDIHNIGLVIYKNGVKSQFLKTED